MIWVRRSAPLQLLRCLCYAATMPPNLAPLDALNLLFLPLMAITIVQAYKGWGKLWDERLTASDRQLLLRIVIFLLLPIVVLFHELGHVAAVKYFGGTVREFHYAFLSGYVVPGERFPANETVWLYFSGNLVQILIGLVAGLCAVVASSPPVVALLVYLALWSVGGTVIIYALLSVTGIYGEWINIYSSQPSTLVGSIAAFHLSMIGLVLWSLYGERPKLWFTCKTDPKWAADYKNLNEQVARNPSAGNWLKLAWSLYRKGLYRACEHCLAQAHRLDPDMPEARILEATVADARGRLNKAIKCYEELIEAPDINENLKLMALLALGQCQLKLRRPDQALKTFSEASVARPDIADPHFFKAALLIEIEHLDEAEAELQTATQLAWIDNSLKSMVTEQIQLLKRKRAPQ